MWRVCVVKWNDGKVMVKCECIGSWHYIFHYCTVQCIVCLLIYITVVVIVFALYSLCVVCPLLFVYFCVLFCLIERGVFCLLCLTVILLPPGKNPYAVKINNSNIPFTVFYFLIYLTFHCCASPRFHMCQI
jgi:hypothetical protein